MALVVIGSQITSAAVTSYDNVFATNDVYSADFPARLNAWGVSTKKLFLN
jgi:hypothetical protein